MNIVIDDIELSKLLNDEFVKTRSRTMFGDSSLEKAVKAAVHEIVKSKIKEMIKGDEALIQSITRELTMNLERQLGLLGKRIAESINSTIIDAIEAEFKTYDD